MIPILIWWLIIQILGWVALPFVMRIFHWLPDRGYTGTKAVGLLLTCYVLWLGASIGFLNNNLGGIIFSILLVACTSIWIWSRKKNQPEGNQPGENLFTQFIQNNKRLVITSEVLFLLAFIFWSVLRAYAPDKIMNAGGEKFMEITFLNGILNSATFPPLDPWLSGFSIAYYYFGYVMMAVITQLSGVEPSVGFELYDALLFALTALGAYGLVFNLIRVSQRFLKKPDRHQSQAIWFSLLGPLFVVIMGNWEGLLEALRSRGVLPEQFFQWIDIPGLIETPVNGSWNPGVNSGWWWWRASRVIQDYDLTGKPIDISPITEFPFFSFLLGDNHPHVLGLPFVLLTISLALNLLLNQTMKPLSKAPVESGHTIKPRVWNPIAYSLQGNSLLFWFSALLLGSLAFLNTWDFPIYLGLALGAFFAGQVIADRTVNSTSLARTAFLGAGVFLCAILLYFFFFVGFDSQAGGILPFIFPPTRLIQYLVMFGTFIFILVGLLISFLEEQSRKGSPVWTVILRAWGWAAAGGLSLYALIALILTLGGWLSEIIPSLKAFDLQAQLGGLPFSEITKIFLSDRLQDPGLFLLLSSIIGLSFGAAQLLLMPDAPAIDHEETKNTADPSKIFVLLLVLSGILLTWSVEFLYLRDIFMLRMNTIFKFYYQGWILLACASAYAVWWIANGTTNRFPILRSIYLGITTLLILAGLVYPVLAINSRTGGFKGEANLDGASGIQKNNPDDWAAIEWLRQHAASTAAELTLLEAPGKSYTYEGRISAFSGIPSLLGWAIHENQWRGSYDEQALREPDIQTIYTTHDGIQALDLLHKWDVDYVIVGSVEHSYIRQVCLDPAKRCNLNAALRKFDRQFQPVFSQGQMTIYAVPGR